MKAKIISGKSLASDLREKMKNDIEELRKKEIIPGLAVILVGDDPASRTYVNAKIRACKETGIHSVIYERPADIREDELISLINQLNQEDTIHGILVQLPLPSHISELKIIETISPEKDVDGFHPINIGKMMIGQTGFLPCTPLGIIQLVKSKNIDLTGKHVVVIGRSNIVGKPVGQLFLKENATVTYCHSKTKDLINITRQADILIVAIGKAKIINKDYIKKGAIVIDVGVNRLSDGSLSGDVDFEQVSQIAGYITPVPGGVGPMTITMLLSNTLLAAKGKKIGCSREFD
ncbi:bifunctional methylenetetrahydrofolate dehydrogenase/methenyltetrahydrofolate cyclohydrolase FolD [Bacillus timonensis]|nr:bifunctional methylenetetrahydrofolate dehydrogenase/methenyltetrahydrofolate cyclohydrolase FolD [Bacillus timonensis]